MNTAPEPTPALDTLSAYERLRAHCLEARAGRAEELGLNILLRHGMLTWARLGVPKCKPALERSVSGAAPPLSAPSPLHAELIDVLVSMAIHCSQAPHSGAQPA
ncbi:MULTISPECIES: hypothetical protein [Thiorhodovibrio]|jgi:hypothetical protein|uniref:hypothetical protein n=1 Tax=Thiorhodovibrio TaxID=61593 RepID=UPI001912B5C1|nr:MULTISPECIES: hypothetical protein [Thiorhodovibrio]MBK5969358.1 hypothetical protein [Thiorhodovibrio winogradskyi]WPL10456.1 hypothetical protein Thiosp_00171 [Thiorhodovibrio litoralis]